MIFKFIYTKQHFALDCTYNWNKINRKEIYIRFNIFLPFSLNCIHIQLKQKDIKPCVHNAKNLRDLRKRTNWPIAFEQFGQLTNAISLDRFQASWTQGLSLRHMMFVFILDCLRFSKLLEIRPSVWCNLNNLLKRKQSSRKQASCVAGFKARFTLCPTFDLRRPIFNRRICFLKVKMLLSRRVPLVGCVPILLPVLKIYSAHNIYYIFSVLPVISEHDHPEQQVLVDQRWVLNQKHRQLGKQWWFIKMVLSDESLDRLFIYLFIL